MSWGVLVDNDAVIVPAPLDWLRNPEVTFEVLLASSASAGPGTVERIRPHSAEIIGIDGVTDAAAAVIQLDRPSAHRPSIIGFDLSAIEQALASDLDPWLALETTGAIEPGLRDLPLDAVLGPVTDWERARRESLVSERIGSAGEVALQLCCLVKLCRHCQDCSGPWWP